MINGPKYHEDMSNFTIQNISYHLKGLGNSVVKGRLFFYIRWYNKLDPALSKNN